MFTTSTGSVMTTGQKILNFGSGRSLLGFVQPTTIALDVRVLCCRAANASGIFAL
jgi:hypothetical protein